MPSSIATPSNLRRWRDGFAIGITAIGLVALASRLFPDLVDERGLFQFLPGGENRLSYPLDYWNAVACLGAMAMAVALCVSAHASRVALRSVALATVPVAALSVFLTYSRFGIAATVIAARVGRASGRIENATASATAHQRPIATALREVRA